MRAVVTGGAGFIGSHLVDRLAGWDVTVVDRATGHSIQEVLVVPPADVIFHLASPVGPVGVLGQEGRIVPEVITTTEIVRRWALWNACPLVYVSTSEVYGSGGRDAETDGCHFAAPTSARKEYAVAKLAAETMLRNTAGLDVRIVRPFNVAGPRQKVDGGFVLPRFIAQAKAGLPLTVYAPGTQRRAFTHVADIVEGLYLAAMKGGSGEVYNLGNPANATTILDLAEAVRACASSRSPIEVVDPRTIHGPTFREAPDKVPDAAKAHRDLDWWPTRDLAQVICDSL